ncbi:hypothetical protein CON36_37560, partial [Bacillus cereus]
FDVDHGAVRQGHAHGGAGRIGQGRGVGDLTAFGDRTGGCQGQTGVVDRVGNRRNGWGGAWSQLFEVAARGAFNGGADGAAVFVDVVRWRVDHHRT